MYLKAPKSVSLMLTSLSKVQKFISPNRKNIFYKLTNVGAVLCVNNHSNHFLGLCLLRLGLLKISICIENFYANRVIEHDLNLQKECFLRSS